MKSFIIHHLLVSFRLITFWSTNCAFVLSQSTQCFQHRSTNYPVTALLLFPNSEESQRRALGAPIPLINKIKPVSSRANSSGVTCGIRSDSAHPKEDFSYFVFSLACHYFIVFGPMVRYCVCVYSRWPRARQRLSQRKCPDDSIILR